MKFPDFKQLGAAMAIVYLSVVSALGCGINWSLPKFHFDSVNEWGYVSYWEDIGEVKMGQKDIPIRIHFLSNRKSSSPYAGYGWSVPLLESRMVQVNEHSFKMWQPDGRFRDFGRDSGNPNLLNGQGGWKAEIRGDTIKAYADCGWGLSFKNGKIASMSTPDGKKFIYRYEGGKVKSILEEGSGESVIEVQQDPLNPEIVELEMGDEKIVLEQGEKPRIERINGQNLIGGMDSSLVKIMKPGGNVREISYDVDMKNIISTFIPQEGRKLTINSVTDLIQSDTDWDYTIRQDSKIAWNNASIQRKTKNQVEHWHKDYVTGKEVIFSDDIRVVKTWFTSGRLNGKDRKVVTQHIGNGRKEIIKYKYDENGYLIGKQSPLYTYASKGEKFYISDKSINQRSNNEQ